MPEKKVVPKPKQKKKQSDRQAQRTKAAFKKILALLREIEQELKLNKDDYDTREALRVFKEWKNPNTHKALMEVYGPYLSHHIGIILKSRNRADIEHSFRFLSYVVGPKRCKMCAGITAKVNTNN